mmetsp:Transcript_70412/g.118096  ORF Transcript_70412/g.118096 Transcript_70412/m.118096 type:complete len:127 (+) Transcript_70412:325-705(+)
MGYATDCGQPFLRPDNASVMGQPRHACEHNSPFGTAPSCEGVASLVKLGALAVSDLFFKGRPPAALLVEVGRVGLCVLGSGVVQGGTAVGEDWCIGATRSPKEVVPVPRVPRLEQVWAQGVRVLAT